jgi:hypothetical protein
MYYLLTISLIVGYMLILCISIFAIIYILIHQKDYGSQLIAFLNILTIIYILF